MGECITKLKVWKANMEEKGLRVNMKKTKILVSGLGLEQLQDSGKYPCAMCRREVRSNTIRCSHCKLWVHKKCCGIAGRLSADPEFVCPKCRGEARPIDGRTETQRRGRNLALSKPASVTWEIC